MSDSKERGAGLTKACGSAACAKPGAPAIRPNALSARSSRRVSSDLVMASSTQPALFSSLARKVGQQCADVTAFALRPFQRDVLVGRCVGEPGDQTKP